MNQAIFEFIKKELGYEVDSTYHGNIEANTRAIHDEIISGKITFGLYKRRRGI